jgi:NAD-dependent SIR2 family protein deacetylase
MKPKKCKICGEETEVGFNIDFKLVPICEGCAKAIFLQQAIWYGEQKFESNQKYFKIK